MEPAGEMLSGFQVNWITLKDTSTGEVIWQGNKDFSRDFHNMNLPLKALNSPSMTRHINFSTVLPWENFRIVQKILFKGSPLEEGFFEYGPVPACSTNTWVSVIEAAPEIASMRPEILSGRVSILTKFYNGDTVITKSLMRIFYTDAL